jgi:beta-phosphoglucomutase-like phosphatase (HAD superfamily)
MTSIEWLIEQIKEYDFTPPSNNEEYVILMTKWIFDAKIDEAKELHKAERIAQLEEIVSRLEEDGLYALPGIKHTLENLKK